MTEVSVYPTQDTSQDAILSTSTFTPPVLRYLEYEVLILALAGNILSGNENDRIPGGRLPINVTVHLRMQIYISIRLDVIYKAYGDSQYCDCAIGVKKSCLEVK